MNLFSLVKEAVTTRQAAERYGLKITGNGMVRCPFHPDRTPSMKVDGRYHCFGCGADGDVIDFAGKLLGLRPADAAKKLAGDFGIDVSEADRGRKHKEANRQSFRPFEPDEKALVQQLADIRRAAERKNLDRQFNRAQDVLIRYSFLLQKWKEQYAPQRKGAGWHPLFVEACQQETWVDYLIDLTYETKQQDKAAFLNCYGTEVNRIERRLADEQPGNHGA